MIEIVNEPRPQPHRIFCVKIKDVPNIFTLDFLREMAQPGYKIGVEHNNSFVFNTNVIFGYGPHHHPAYMPFKIMMGHAAGRNYSLLMISK